MLTMLLKGLVQQGGSLVRGHLRERAERNDPPVPTKLADSVDVDAIFAKYETGEDESTEPARAALDGPLPPLPELDDDTELGDSLGAARPSDRHFPPGLLDVVVGLDYEKRMVRQVVDSDNYRLHILMVGPPGSAKSLILDLLRNGIPDESRIIVGAQATEVGMKKMLLAADHPRLLLFEELDKAPLQVENALLTAMDGKVTNAIGTPDGQREDLELQVHVIAAANSTARMSGPLLDRFNIVHLPDYTEAERHQVMVGVLVKRLNLDSAAAKEIADLVAPKGTIRDAERAGGIWKSDPELAKDYIARIGKR